jgi:hypothetical protein
MEATSLTLFWTSSSLQIDLEDQLPRARPYVDDLSCATLVLQVAALSCWFFCSESIGPSILLVTSLSEFEAEEYGAERSCGDLEPRDPSVVVSARVRNWICRDSKGPSISPSVYGRSRVSHC